MKKLYMIGGAMGVGKTTVCQILKRRLDNCAFLDGDWCWDMHPFRVTGETKALVLGNICHVLNSFLDCEAFDNVVFCWVMHDQAVIDAILSRLHTSGWDVKRVSLVCSERALRERLRRDIDAGVRDAGVLERALDRLRLYPGLDTHKLDVTELSPEEAALEILRL